MDDDGQCAGQSIARALAQDDLAARLLSTIPVQQSAVSDQRQARRGRIDRAHRTEAAGHSTDEIKEEHENQI